MRAALRLLACASLLSAPCLGARRNTVPQVTGKSVTVDRYVKEYADAMSSAQSQMDAITAQINALPSPATASEAFTQEAQVLSLYAPMVGLMSKAESAQQKMLKHVLGAEGSMDQEFDVMLGLPQFEGKKDDASVAPQEDELLKGEAGKLPPPPKPEAKDPMDTPDDEKIHEIRDRMRLRQDAARIYLDKVKKAASGPGEQPQQPE
jgi:hypothetical protein